MEQISRINECTTHSNGNRYNALTFQKCKDLLKFVRFLVVNCPVQCKKGIKRLLKKHLKKQLNMYEQQIMCKMYSKSSLTLHTYILYVGKI